MGFDGRYNLFYPAASLSESFHGVEFSNLRHGLFFIHVESLMLRSSVCANTWNQGIEPQREGFPVRYFATNTRVGTEKHLGNCSLGRKSIGGSF